MLSLFLSFSLDLFLGKSLLFSLSFVDSSLVRDRFRLLVFFSLGLDRGSLSLYGGFRLRLGRLTLNNSGLFFSSIFSFRNLDLLLSLAFLLYVYLRLDLNDCLSLRSILLLNCLNFVDHTSSLRSIRSLEYL